MRQQYIPISEYVKELFLCFRCEFVLRSAGRGVPASRQVANGLSRIFQGDERERDQRITEETTWKKIYAVTMRPQMRLVAGLPR